MKVYDPDTIRKSCLRNAALPRPTEFSQKAKGAVRVVYNAELSRLPGMLDVDEDRTLVWGYVLCPEDEPFHPLHSRDLTPQQFNALGLWATERVGGEYKMRSSFPEELAWALTKVRMVMAGQQVAAGQLTFGDLLGRYQTTTGPIDINGESDRKPDKLSDVVAEALKQGGAVTAVYDGQAAPAQTLVGTVTVSEPEAAYDLGF
jgi:hypothetical protein